MRFITVLYIQNHSRRILRPHFVAYSLPLFFISDVMFSLNPSAAISCSNVRCIL